MPPLDDLLAEARRRLVAVPRESLGEIVVPKRILGVARAMRIVPAGEAWHLGALLLGDDALWATGEIVRAREEVPRGYTAASQRERAALAGAARRGGFLEGATVHLGWSAIDLAAVAGGGASGPIAMRAGIPSIRWSAVGGFMPLERYIDERIELQVNPPGA